MKKLYFLLSATLTLASCNNGTLPSTDSDSNVPTEIRLGANHVLDVNLGTRSTGGIGSIDPTKKPEEQSQEWLGETIHVYAINTQAENSSDLSVEINAIPAIAPSGKATGVIEWNESKHYYYNPTGVYTFYAMHIDDAALTSAPYKANGTKEEILGNGLSFNVEINGGQDLMVANTVPEEDIKKAIESNEAHKADLENAKNKDFIYSAWSARRDVVPNLQFKHLLSRLFFVAKADYKEIDSGKEVVITGITIKNTKYKGELTVIPGKDKPQGLTADKSEGNMTDIVLQELTENNTGTEKVLEKLKPISIMNDTPVQIGESLLLFPTDDEKGYTVEIYTQQDADGNGEISEVERATIKSNITIKNEDDANKFVEGKYYVISLTVRNMKEIEVNATLAEWAHGGNHDIDTDTPFDPEVEKGSESNSEPKGN